MRSRTENKRHVHMNPGHITVISGGACLAVMAICAMVDYSISKEITWSLAYLIAIPFIWAICIPILTKSPSLAVWLSFISICALPYLFLLEQIIPGRGWFAQIALPCAVLGIISLWVCFFVIKRLKNKWFMAALILFLLGGVLSPGVNLLFRFISNQEIYISITNIMSAASCGVISAIFCVIGIIKRKRLSQT